MENQSFDWKSELKNLARQVCKVVRRLPVVGNVLEKKQRVAVLRLSGVIADTSMKRGGISHARYAKLIEKAFRMPGLEAVVLVINSPGGSPAQSSLIAGHIRRLAQEKKKPVFAFVEDVAASGGYWLACSADEIYAQENSIVGSIGVISAGFGFEDFIEKYNVHRRLHTSGKNKSFLDPFSPEKDKDVAHLKEIQKELHEGFKAWVKERRGAALKSSDAALFEGNFWTGAKALELGLVDGFGEMRAVMQEKFGRKLKFSELQPEKKLLPSLMKMESAADTGWLHEALGVIEDRVYWQRFGL